VRDAQRERVRRIDAIARALLAEHAQAAREADEPGFAERPLEARLAVLRRKAYEPVMTVHRTMANPAFVDPAVDADPEGATREYGSLLSDRPDLMNMTMAGFAHVTTPRAWLSTWSALSSHADLVANAARVDEPTLVVHAARDREVYFDRDVRPVLEASAARDKKLVRIEGARHYFEPDFGETAAPDVERVMDVVVPWIKERFA
jgi:alpha-beta hydrolase superfamily lysophospholipase